MKYLDIGGVAHRVDENDKLYRLSEIFDQERYDRAMAWAAKSADKEFEESKNEYAESLEKYNQLPWYERLFKRKPELRTNYSWLELALRSDYKPMKQIWTPVTEERENA